MKLFPKVLLFFLIAILGLFCIYLLVVRFVPSFGGDLTTDQKQAFSRLENFNSALLSTAGVFLKSCLF